MVIKIPAVTGIISGKGSITKEHSKFERKEQENGKNNDQKKAYSFDPSAKPWIIRGKIVITE